MRTWSSGQLRRFVLTGLLSVAQTLPAHAAEPTSGAPPVAESGQAEAIRLFREAKALYTDGKPREAALAFERSFAAAASPEAAYNAALAHDKTDDPIATLTWFRRYLEIAHKDTDPSYPLALTRADELRGRVAELRVELARPGEVREIRVNDQPVPSDSFPRLVRPGRVALQFVGEAGQLTELESEARAGETATIYFPGFAAPRPTITPPRPKATPTDPPPDPAKRRRQRALKAAFWTGTGLTVASAAIMGAFGGLAVRKLGAYDQQTADCQNAVDMMMACATTRPDRELLLQSAERYQGYTNAWIGVTAGLAVVTLALGIAAIRESRRSRAPTRTGQLTPTMGGLIVAF